MPSVYLRLNLSKEECLSLYTRSIPWVTARSIDGRNVQFPSRILKTLVQHQGIQGLFRFTYSDEGKFVSIERVAN